MIQDDSRETSNINVVYLHEIYNFSLHNSFQKCLNLKLLFYDHVVMKLNTWWNFALIWSGFWPNFMALFHIVPRGIFKSNSNIDCIAHFNISKMSKNSLRSFLSRENRRDEVRVLSLELQVILDEHMNQINVRMHNICFAGLKLVYHSIIKFLHNL